MLQHPENKMLKSNKNEINEQVCFLREDFEGKEFIFILAKTWGAAKMFFEKTKLHQFKNRQIEYLSIWEQLVANMQRNNTVIIQLTGALDTEENLTTLRVCEARNLNILVYPAVIPATTEFN